MCQLHINFKKDNLVKSYTSIYNEFTSTSFIKPRHSFMVTVIETEKFKVIMPSLYLIIRLNDIVLYIRNQCKNIIVLPESSPNFTSNHFWFPCYYKSPFLPSVMNRTLTTHQNSLNFKIFVSSFLF